jgi:hypothetical protein
MILTAGMKELLSKKFWRDVKKTFDEAREDTISDSGDSTAVSPAEVKPEADPAGKVPALADVTRGA